MIEQPTDPKNSMEPHMVDPTYTEADDPAINLLSGPGDLSSRAKELLRTEITLTSGWTQKRTALPSLAEPQKTLVIWWRYGKEHGEGDGFRLNPPATIAQHLDAKAAQFRATPEDQWRWWRAGNVIVERPNPTGYGYGPDSRIYYLVERGLTVVENIHLRDPWQAWPWYIHLADIVYDAHRDCWISKDLFCDVILTSDGQRYHVNDLGDVGHALHLGLLSVEQATQILRRTDALLEAIALGHFPFPEIVEAQALCRRLGW